MIGARTSQAGLSPPLGSLGECPDPRWGAGRALVLGGPVYFVGPYWRLPASNEGRPAGPAPVPPILPAPTVPEGAIPFVDWVQP
jgi:hypothetical protein